MSMLDPQGIATLERQAIQFGAKHARNWLSTQIETQIRAANWPAHLADPDGGQPYHLKEWPTRQINTAVGTLRIKVPCYRKTGKPTLMPHVLMLGLRDSISPLLMLRLASLAAELPFAAAATELLQLTGVELSRETVRVVAEELGDTALQAQLEPVVPAAFATPRRIMVFIDGGRVNTDHGWREPRLARIELFDASGRRFTTVLSRICTADAFWELLEPLLLRLGADRCGLLAFAGDGSLWILPEARRRFPKDRFPQALFILDFYHAAEHLHDTGKKLFGEGRESRGWASRYARMLKRGRVDRVLAELCVERDAATGRKHTALVKLLKYFEPRRKQMKYATFRRRGWPIGSGRIEALVKQALNLRLKRNGAWWSLLNAERMLALRSAKLFDQLSDVWRRDIAARTSRIPPALQPILAPLRNRDAA